MALAAFTSSLIKNIPDENIPKEIDLVLDGGAFNGIYMMGSLNYLKQLEKNNKISIIRVSGCSIGGILGVCYLLDKLDNILALCKDCFKYLRKHQVLKKNVELFKNYFNETITDDDLIKINNKLYLTYFNTHKGKQVMKKKYKSKDHLIDILLKSLYIPFLIDNNIIDKDGCVDGAYPYIFKQREDKRKILFINLQSFSRIKNMIFIKNEKNIFPRLLEGLMDTHKFFETKKSNNMCSYVNDWNLFNIICFRLRESIYTFLIYILIFGLKIENIIPEKWKKDKFVQRHIQIFKRLWRDLILYISI